MPKSVSEKKIPIFEQAAQQLAQDLINVGEEEEKSDGLPMEICEWAEDNFYIPHAYIDGKWVRWEKPIILSPYQKEAFGIIMPKVLSGEVTLVVWSEIKKSGKTTVEALVGQWWAEEMEPYNEIIFIANDKEQAESRGFAMLIDSVEINPKDDYRIRRRVGDAFHNERKTNIKAIPCDYKGEAGGNQGLSLWDELWAYSTERAQRLWDEMTPPPTRSVAIRWVVTYAGFKGESTLLWGIYEDVVGHPRIKEENRVPGTDLPIYQKGSTIVFWSHEPRQPWQTARYYAQQKDELRPTAYVRLHENRWVQKESAFVPMDMWDDCVTPEAERWASGNPLPLIIAIDASESLDCTAMAATFADPETGKVLLLDHQIWRPEPSDLIQGRNIVDLVETVQARVLALAAAGAEIPLIVYDPFQMSTVALNLAKRDFYVRPFSQGDPRIKADTGLFLHITSGNLEVYEGAEDLRDHIENAVKKESEKGFRISKDKAAKHCDGAVALSMSVFAATDPEFFQPPGGAEGLMF